MIEDKLTHDERLRLECVAQAIAHATGVGASSTEYMITGAKKIEEYVRGN